MNAINAESEVMILLFIKMQLWHVAMPHATAQLYFEVLAKIGRWGQTNIIIAY